MNWYFDTSVLVSAAVTHHPHNIRALAILERMVAQKHHGHISAHSLTEIYSVSTRTPFKPPLHPTEAWRIIQEMVLPHMRLVTLTSKAYREVIRECAIAGRAGGKIHDAIHVRCAEKSKCDRLYTFNVKDFRALAPKELENKISAP